MLRIGTFISNRNWPASCGVITGYSTTPAGQSSYVIRTHNGETTWIIEGSEIVHV